MLPGVLHFADMNEPSPVPAAPPDPPEPAEPPVPADPPAETAPPAPEAPLGAEATRDFGPEWQGERTSDLEAEGKGDKVEVTACEFAGSITAIGVVKDGEEKLLEKWSATPAAVGVAEVEAHGTGNGPVMLRLHISS